METIDKQQREINKLRDAKTKLKMNFPSAAIY